MWVIKQRYLLFILTVFHVRPEGKSSGQVLTVCLELDVWDTKPKEKVSSTDSTVMWMP